MVFTNLQYGKFIITNNGKSLVFTLIVNLSKTINGNLKYFPVHVGRDTSTNSSLL